MDNSHEDQLIDIALHDLEVARKIVELGPDHFPKEYHDVLAAMAETTAEGQLLTRKAHEVWAERQGHSPRLIGANNSIITRHNAKPVDPALADQLLKALREKRLLLADAEAINEFNKNRKNENAREVLIEKLSRVTSKECSDPLADAEIIDLKDRLPAPIAAIMGYLASQTNEQPSAKHLFCAVTVAAAAIGKRATFSNWGSDYYLNLATVILGPSGSNKTGLYNSVNRLVKECVQVYCPATSTIEAFVENYCDHVAPDKKRSSEETRALKRAIYQKHERRMDGELVLIDEFRSFLLSMVPREQSVRNGQVFCRILDAAPVEMSTITSGCRVVGSTAFSFLGFSQADPWNEEMRSVAQQVGGLAGRIIPVNNELIRLEGNLPVGANEQICRDWVKAFTTLKPSEYHDEPFDNDIAPVTTTWAMDKVTIVFGKPGEDQLGNTKQWFRENSTIAQYAIKNDPHPFELIESKLLIQAAKFAAVLALADAIQKGEVPTTLDAGGWLRLAFALVGRAHLSNHYRLVSMTEEAAQQEKIVAAIRRHGSLSSSQIARRCNIKPYVAKDYAEALVAEGQLLRKSTSQTIKYTLRA